MELQHVNAKIFVDGDLPIDPARFIDVFHRWIQQQLFDEMLIDVADYRHVPAGPGVMLIALEADYSLDQTGGRNGLRYNRKAPLEGTNEDRIQQALRAAAQACHLLEREFEDDGPLRFSRREFELFINDRALAPNTPETYEAVKPQFESCLANVLGHGEFELRPQSDPRRLFGFTVEVARPFELDALLQPAA